MPVCVSGEEPPVQIAMGADPAQQALQQTPDAADKGGSGEHSEEARLENGAAADSRNADSRNEATDRADTGRTDAAQAAGTAGSEVSDRKEEIAEGQVLLADAVGKMGASHTDGNPSQSESDSGNSGEDAEGQKPDRTAEQQAADDIAPPNDDARHSVADDIQGHGQPNKDTAEAQAEAPRSRPQSDSQGLKLFGTVEFRGKLNSVPRWTDALKRNSSAPLFTDENVKLSAKFAWKDLKDRLRKMGPLDQLKAVNSFWNQWPYRTDKEVWGKEDYGASPKEFRAKSGDCEDYSIAKYFTLKEIGWPAEKMRIVVVKETIRNIGHAVLAVYLDDKIYILDILSKNVLEQRVIRNYVPQFSVNEHHKWMHIKPNKK